MGFIPLYICISCRTLNHHLNKPVFKPEVCYLSSTELKCLRKEKESRVTIKNISVIVKEISQDKMCCNSEKTVVELYRKCNSLIKSTGKRSNS